MAPQTANKGGSHDVAQGLASLNASILKSGCYSDLTIKCHGNVFKVHRNIVAVQSKPLAAAIDGDFKEAKTSMIDLEDDDPNIIEKFIHFLYTQQYDDGRGVVDETQCEGARRYKAPMFQVNEEEAWLRKMGLFPNSNTIPSTGQSIAASAEVLHINTALYIAGEKYDVPALKTLAKEKYESVVSAAWNCASFTSSLELLYAETPETDRVLKDIAMKAAAKHVKELVNSPEFVDLCQKNGEIGVDVLKACFPRSVPAPIKTVKSILVDICPNCGSNSFESYQLGEDFYCRSCRTLLS